MKLAEMKVADILQNEVFIDNIDAMRKELQEEYETAKRKADARGEKLKKNVVVKLIERGQWETPTIIYLYSQILNRQLQGFSASERRMINGLCNEAYNKTIERMMEDEKEDIDTSRHD